MRDKRKIKWHPLVLHFTLNLKYLSTSAYRAIQQSGIISLPSARTLDDYTHWMTPQSGLQIEFVEELGRLLAQHLPSGQHDCTLAMDEMKIKSGLVFNKHSGTLVGFVDLGSVNRDIEQVMGGDTQDSLSWNLASQVFVIMARATEEHSECYSS